MRNKFDFNIILYIIALLLVAWFVIVNSGCMTAKRIEKFKGIYCCDSISVQFKEKIVKIPVFYSDSSMFEAYLTCDSIGNIYYTQWKQTEGKYTDLQATLQNNVLSGKVYIKIHDTIKTVQHDTIKYNQVVKVTNQLTTGQSFWLVLGKVFVCVVSALILFFVIRFFVKKYLLKK